jgi:alpha-beta hydrolase superfamily lysophospholipase
MLATTNGLNLYTKNYLVPNAAANVLVVHGLGEHCERYAHVAEALNGIGANVYTFDLRGHGKSEGEPVLIKNITEYREDVEAVYQTIEKDKPLFILGHSMGGLVALHFLLFGNPTDIRGVVLTGPAIKEGDDINFFTKLIVQILGRIAPKLQTVKLKPESISRDAVEVQKYITDPLVYSGGTKAGLGLALLNAISAIKPRFTAFQFPVLLMHGEADKITNLEGSKAFYAQCASQDKTLKVWDGAFHEILNETNKTEIIETMTDWIKTRI